MKISPVQRARWGVVGLIMALAWGSLQAQSAADFALPDLSGQIHKLSDYRGKWVLVNYWATWCPPCREELPELEVFYSSDKDRVMVLGVNMEDIDRGALKVFVDDQFLSYPILRATADDARLVGPVTALPTSYLINPEGEIVARQVGPVTAENIRSFIDDYEANAS